MERVIHGGEPVVDEVLPVARVSCIAENALYDKELGWRKCQRVGKYLVDDLSVCEAHKKHILKYGRLVTTNPTEIVSTIHRWPFVEEACRQKSRQAHREAAQREKQRKYETALLLVAQTHGLSKGALLCLIPKAPGS